MTVAEKIGAADQRLERMTDTLRRLVRRGARSNIAKLLSKLRPADVAYIIRGLTPNERFAVLQILIADYPDAAGEVLTELELAPAWYVVLTPQVAVSTAEIFSAPELTRAAKPIKITAFFKGFGRNDLEPVVCARYPEVAEHLVWLRSFGDARMSGSGSSLFAEFASEAEARAVVARIPETMRGVAVGGLDRHPLAVR